MAALTPLRTLALAAIIVVLGVVLWNYRSAVRANTAAPTPTATVVPVAARRVVPDILVPIADCANAIAPTEKLICSDDELKLVERELGVAYASAVRELPAEKQDALREDHAAWYADYVQTCDTIGGGEMLKKCIFEHLSNRTRELDERFAK